MIYVTGAAGFIGSHLVKELKSKNHEVMSCDVRSPLMIQPEDLLYNFKKNRPRVVFHLGAISSTVESNTVSMTESNILLSCRLLEYCLALDVPFVYASSASVYGLGEHGFSEASPHTPLNYYAISKSSFDMYALQKLKDKPDSRVFGLRFFNVYGTNEDHKGNMASPVHKFIKQSKEKGEIEIFKGSENFKRDFIHVSDVIKATLAAKDFSEPGIYNVGTGKAKSFKDVALAVSEAMGSEIKEIAFPSHLVGKYQSYTCSNNTKIKSQGFKIKHKSLKDGVSQVLGLDK